MRVEWGSGRRLRG
ncbi:hypothetical protein CP09DC78_1220, partial [Chlamydia psittaci 09DC78]